MLRWLFLIICLCVAVYFILPKDMRPWWPKAQEEQVAEAPAEVVEETTEVVVEEAPAAETAE